MTLAEHRAAARIAWRQARRAKQRTALVIALVGLPIAALAAGGFVIQSAIASPEQRATGQLGSADMGINYYSQDLTVDELVRALPPGSRVTYSRAVNFQRIIDGGEYGLNVTESSTPPDQPPLRARYVTLKGRMPHTAGEAAVHPRLARILHVTVGDELTIPEFDLRLHVVGFAEYREDVRNLLILAGPGTLDARAAATLARNPGERGETDVFPIDWLVDLPAGVTPSEAVPNLGRPDIEGEGRFGFYTRQSVIDQYRRERFVLSGAAFGGTVGALFGTGLIAGAAFGVGARRQLRTLGLVGAAGGEARHGRSIVLWGGTVLGAAGSVVGVAVAIAVAFIVTPRIDWLMGRVVDSVRLPWAIIAGALILGPVAATVAAIGPARHAGKISTVDALAARTPKPKPAGLLARRGFVVVIVGGFLVAAGAAWRQEKILAVGFVITLLGFMLAIPLLVTAVGRLPARLPTSLRLAARQTSRYGRRTGAAVAAATLALTAPVAIAADSMSDEAFRGQRLSIRADQLLLHGSSEKDPDGYRKMVAAATVSTPGSVVAPIRRAVAPSQRPGASATEEVPWYVYGPEVEVETGVFSREMGLLAIGDASMLRAVDADKAIASLELGKIVAVGALVEAGRVRIASGEGDGRTGAKTVPAIAVGQAKQVGDEGEVPRYFISENEAARYGLRPGIVEATLLRARHALSGGDVARVRRAISAFPGASVISRDDLLTTASALRLGVTGAATLLALIIVAVVVALVASESRRDHAVVVAVGADPGIRRRTVAANAFLVTALAGILAVPAGLVPVALIEVARTQNQPIVVPWDIIGIVAVGAPLLAGVIAAAFSRQPTSHDLLQPAW